jgi:hypothetical protein
VLDDAGIVGPQVSPGPAADKRGTHSCLLSWHQIVVAVIPDIHNLVRAARCGLDNAAEECLAGLGDPPVGRGSDEVGRQVHRPEDAPCHGGLVSRNADPQAHRPQRGERGPRVRVQVLFPVGLSGARFLAPLPFGGQVEAGPEVAEGLGVVPAGRGDRAEHRGEGVAGHADPVRPGTEFPGVVE